MRICSMNAHGSGQLHLLPLRSSQVRYKTGILPILETADQCNMYVFRGKMAERWKSNTESHKGRLEHTELWG